MGSNSVGDSSMITGCGGVVAYIIVNITATFYNCRTFIWTNQKLDASGMQGFLIYWHFVMCTYIVSDYSLVPDTFKILDYCKFAQKRHIWSIITLLVRMWFPPYLAGSCFILQLMLLYSSKMNFEGFTVNLPKIYYCTIINYLFNIIFWGLQTV